MNDVLVLLFSAGAAAFLTAIVSGISKLRSQKAESEEAIIKRLNDTVTSAHRDANIQRKLREKAESRLETVRQERDDAQDENSRLYRYIIDNGLPDPRKHDDVT